MHTHVDFIVCVCENECTCRYSLINSDDCYGKTAAKDADLPVPELEQKMRRYINDMKDISNADQGSDRWLNDRRCRLTASNFGAIGRMREKTSPKNSVKNLLYTPFKGNSATAYGLEQEAATEEMFVQYLEPKGASEISVAHPGLVGISGEQALAASPDGIICCHSGSSNFPSSFVVEYKNPKKLVDQGMTVDDPIGVVKGFPLMHGNNGYELKKTHNYYYQVQGVMAATGLSDAAFVIRGDRESMEVVWIKFDRHFFEGCLKKLRRFYYEALLPELAHPLVSVSGVRPYYVEWEYSDMH